MPTTPESGYSADKVIDEINAEAAEATRQEVISGWKPQNPSAATGANETAKSLSEYLDKRPTFYHREETPPADSIDDVIGLDTALEAHDMFKGLPDEDILFVTMNGIRKAREDDDLSTENELSSYFEEAFMRKYYSFDEDSLTDDEVETALREAHTVYDLYVTAMDRPSTPEEDEKTEELVLAVARMAAEEEAYRMEAEREITEAKGEASEIEEPEATDADAGRALPTPPATPPPAAENTEVTATDTSDDEESGDDTDADAGRALPTPPATPPPAAENTEVTATDTSDDEESGDDTDADAGRALPTPPATPPATPPPAVEDGGTPHELTDQEPNGDEVSPLDSLDVVLPPDDSEVHRELFIQLGPDNYTSFMHLIDQRIEERLKGVVDQQTSPLAREFEIIARAIADENPEIGKNMRIVQEIEFSSAIDGNQNEEEPAEERMSRRVISRARATGVGSLLVRMGSAASRIKEKVADRYDQIIVGGIAKKHDEIFAAALLRRERALHEESLRSEDKNS